MNEETFSFEIAKLTLKPGDILVVRTLRGTLAESSSDRLHRSMRKILSDAGHPETQVLVISDDFALEIIEHAA